jgi:two-component system, LytTR family, sensor kinase
MRISTGHFTIRLCMVSLTFIKDTMYNDKRVIYWIAQTSGWLLYVLILAFWAVVSGQFEWPIVKVWVTVFVTGVAVSHLFRAIILWRNWLRLKFYNAVFRLFLMSVLMGLLSAVIHAVVSDLFFAEIRPILTWPFGELMQVTLAYAPEMLIWSLIYFAWNYLSNYEREEIKNLRLQASNNEIELNNLKSQLNPHFMFNAMNSIRALIDENPELAKKSVTQLSNILRNTLIVGRHRFIPFEDELRVVQNYLELEGIRYEERLRVNYEIDPAVLSEPIPPLMLQTLVENAIKHGISKLIGGGEIKITAKKLTDGYFLEIRNTGQLNDVEVPISGIGISNTRKRLKLLYKENADFKIYKENQEVIAEIVFPNHNSNENYNN